MDQQQTGSDQSEDDTEAAAGQEDGTGSCEIEQTNIADGDAGGDEAEGTSLSNSDQKTNDECNDDEKKAESQSKMKTGGHGIQQGVTGIADEEATVQDPTSDDGDGDDGKGDDDDDDDEDDHDEESVADQPKNPASKHDETTTKEKTVGLYAPERMTKNVVRKLTDEEVHVTNLNETELNDVIETDDDDVKDARIMIEQTSRDMMRPQDEDDMDAIRITTLTMCYKVWVKHFSEGRAEKRSEALMKLMDVKTGYDANRRIARLPLTDTFWKVHTACSILLQDINWENEAQLVKENINREDGFEIVENIKTNFVVLTLFLRCNEVGLLYGARTNFRLASKVGLTSNNNLSQSMLGCAYAQDETEEKFTNSKLGVTFYSLVKSTKRFADTPLLGSIALEDVKLGKNTLNTVEIQIPQASAKHVTAKEFLKVAYILNLKPKKESLEFNEIFDFEALLGSYANEKVNTLVDIETFVKEKLRWEFFKINENDTVSYVLYQLRSFFQVLTGVGVSIMEGSHRMTLAAKLLTGVAVDWPLPLNIHQKRLRDQIPASSQLYNLIYTDVLIPSDAKDAGMHTHGFLSDETITQARQWSQNVSVKKTHFIPATWKGWIAETLEKLDDNKAVTEGFFKTMGKGTRYIPALLDVEGCVAESLITKMPAKTLAQKGKRIPGKEERGTGSTPDIDTEGFKLAVVSGKGKGLAHNWFNRVLTKYRPDEKIVTSMLPTRHTWNDPMPCIYLALFTWLATVDEGRRALADFAATADPLFAHHYYIANVVLMPVNKIVKHLMDISVIEGFVTYKEMSTNTSKYHRYRLLLMYYITRRYIEALTNCSKSKDSWDVRDGDALGTSIAGMQGVTKVLRNLPKAYQRWNSCYKEIDKKQKPKGTQRGKKKPFDMTLRLHCSFSLASERHAESEDGQVMLDPSWDPLEIALMFHNRKISMDIFDSEFNDDRCQLYNEGEPANKKGSIKDQHVPQGSPNASKKRKPDQDKSPGSSKKAAARSPASTNTRNKEVHIEESEESEESSAKRPKMTKADVIEVITDSLGHWPGAARIKKQIATMCSNIAKGIVERFTDDTVEKEETLFTADDIPSRAAV